MNKTSRLELIRSIGESLAASTPSIETEKFDEERAAAERTLGFKEAFVIEDEENPHSY